MKQPSAAYQNSCQGNFFSQVSFYEDELQRIYVEFVVCVILVSASLLPRSSTDSTRS